MSSRNVLQLSHSHHFIRVKARKNSFGFLNAVPGKNDVGVSALILIDLPVFKNVGSSSEQRNLSTLRIIGWASSVVYHAHDFVPFFVNEDQFGARSAFLTGKMSDVVDSAQYSESVHPFVQILDHHVSLLRTPLSLYALALGLLYRYFRRVVDQINVWDFLFLFYSDLL